MPETTRTEITAARESLARATTLAGWGLLYLVAGALWWPGQLIAVAIVGTAWQRARTATDTYARLIEATGRLHTAELAKSLGIHHSGPLNQRTGWALTCLLQGQSHLIPLTTRLAESPEVASSAIGAERRRERSCPVCPPSAWPIFWSRSGHMVARHS
ncbi:MAG: hypothetical protein ACRDUV_14070 [Pseudonocardiaceae bacterium]